MIHKRILILEDEFLIAEVLREDLEALGATVLGPALDCAAALELLWQGEPPDLAILDTHIGSETCKVVLNECRSRQIPVMIFSGHGPDSLPAFASGLPRLAKPYLADALAVSISSLP